MRKGCKGCLKKLRFKEEKMLENQMKPTELDLTN